MSLSQILMNAYVRPLADYYHNQLPHASPAKLNADLRGGVMGGIEDCAKHCRIGGLGPALWYEVTALCYQLLVRSSAEGVRNIAEIYTAQLPEVLAADLSLGDKFSLYDMLKHLYAMSAKDHRALHAFEETVIRAYVDWISTFDSVRQSQPVRRPMTPGRRLRVGYLCNNAANMAPGKPAAPLFISLILDHQRQFDHEVFVYSPGNPPDDWAKTLAALGISVTPLAFTGYATRDDAGMPESLARLRRDRLDVILTDDNLALPTYLYEHRVAPVQVYVAMGMLFWGIRNLDYLLPGPMAAADCGAHLPLERQLPGRICYHPRLLDRPADAAGAAVRGRIPADHRIAGVFARFVKLSSDHLTALGRILEANPKLSIVIAGNGDPSRIGRFVAESGLGDRVLFFEHDVDIFTYGRMIDFFLDTFPFPSGNSVREVQYFGKPVISLHVDAFARFFAESRDAELVAIDIDAYVRIAGRLAQDSDYLAERSAVAHRLGAVDVREGGNAALLGALVERATRDLSALCVDA